MTIWIRGLLAALLLLFTAGFAQAAIPETERAALLALYQATDGANWSNNSGWNGAVGTECSWFGVTCNADETSVTGLSLPGNQLRGPLPDALLDLNLTSNDLHYNAVYTGNLNLITLLDASGPIGSLHETQTLDADGIVLGNIQQTSLDISWNPVAYSQAGGYRIYMAAQIDSDTGSVMTDYIQIADITDKLTTSLTVPDLIACRQYFFKVVSYTSAHTNSVAEVMSDGVGGPIVGTMPGYVNTCPVIGSPYADVFNIDSNSTAYPVMIEVADSGARVYQLNGNYLFAVDGGSGVDSLYATGNTISLGDVSAETISAVAFETINASGDLVLNGGDTNNTWDITGSNSGTLNGTISFNGVSTITGGNSDDLFVIDGNISLSTTIDGGTGTNSITVSGTSGINGDIFLSGPGITNVQTIEYTGPVFSAEPVNWFIFEQTDFEGYYIPENAEPTALVALLIDKDKLAETDLEIDFTFEIIAGDDEGVFEVNQDDDMVKLVGSLDYEETRQYDLTLAVFINGISLGNKEITVFVTDVQSGGCSLRPGAPFDPIWVLMLLMASIYYFYRRSVTR